MRIALAQIDLMVGDISGNTDKIISYIKLAGKKHSADLIIFPELSITGYPPDDLLLRNRFIQQVAGAFERITKNTNGTGVVIGYPEAENGRLFNSASYLVDGQIVCTYRKQDLPNYGVFDEKRYFTSVNDARIINISSTPIALSICEDLWTPEPALRASAAGAKLIININASPYHLDKMEQRLEVLRQRVRETGLSIVYLNLVGGQDEVVFDGGSMIMDASGNVIYQAPVFEEGLYVVDLELNESSITVSQDSAMELSSGGLLTIYRALVTGVHDYVIKNGFKGAVIGLSGGIDSALTLVIAVDALGADNIEVLLMPSRYTSGMSIDDSRQMAEDLGVKHHVIDIEKPFMAFTDILEPVFAGMPADVTEENIQARCRGIILMALSNKTGKIVLTTGNKSEMAVGYATLYGDMAGGFAPLKDVSKTLVYELANWLNRDKEVIPQRIIDRPPTAELRENQKDEDSLPPYEVLDRILEQYIEKDMGPDQIISNGFNSDTVHEIVRLIDRNEYKRRQAAPGVKITRRAFGRDRRYPITSGYIEK